ncbi:aldo/keto reductase [Novosphingobium beihaiensis]|uniref:Aldo/keto reductase n=1 Tax=Novosphingobium beihaiensis TaxID=2930389 RepID=A0ABT0BN01_9SPHN|nr:aldo/keto reductase [Novosphingobium beihaiensis]MCJ2186425.1 aldo/keto reductase [Novosphingobium beihaiensis]
MADISGDHPALAGIPLVLGGNVFGWTIGRDTSFAVLDAFYEAGGRMIDTAEGYSNWVPGNKGGESEAIIGEWMESRGVREDMRIGTKTGQGGAPGALDPAKVRQALEGSLERLRTDYVDLYYAHRDDGTTPLEEVAGVYGEIFRAGKARELGASNYSAARLAEVLATADRLGARPFSVLQPLYNLVERKEYEGPLQDACLSHGIAVLPYYGLAAGFLTGKYNSAADWAGSSRAFSLDETAAHGGWSVLAALREIAGELGTAPAQAALAWLRARPGIAAPIASATTPEQVTTLIEATHLNLAPAQIDRLDRAQHQGAA